MTDLYQIPDGADVTTVPNDAPVEDAAANSGGFMSDAASPFASHFRASMRSSTTLGAAEAEAIQGTLQGKPNRTGRQRMRDTVAKIGGPDAPQYPQIDQSQQKYDLALNKAIEDAVYKNMPAFSGGVAGALGTLAGSFVDPVNLIGFEGLIARKIPMLAGPGILPTMGRTAIDAAVTNTAIDPVIQAGQIASGAQAGYEWQQTAIAPVAGALFGGAIGGAGAVVAKALGRGAPGEAPAFTDATNQAAVRALDQNARADANVQRFDPKVIAEAVTAPEPLKSDLPATAADVKPVEAKPAPDLMGQELPATAQPAARLADQPASTDIAPAIDGKPKDAVDAAPAPTTADPSQSPATRDMLENPASWVIREKDSGNVVMETFDRAKVDALNTEKYEAIPILQYLGEVNAAVRNAQNPRQPASPQADMVARGQETGPAQTGDIEGSLFKRKAPGAVAPDQIVSGRPAASQGVSAGDARVQSVQNIARGIVDDLNKVVRTGRVTPGVQGEYKIKSGVVRVKNYGDLDTLMHEVGHEFHMSGPAKADVDALVAANRAELATFGAGNGQRGDAEAFANLYALYALNKPFAEASMPNATAALDNLLKTKFPETSRVLESARQSLEALHTAPSQAVVSANNISAPPPKFTDRFKQALGKDRDPFGRTTYSAMDAFYTGFVDKDHPIYKAAQGLVSIAKQNGKSIQLNPIDNPYIQMRLLSGANGAADTQLKHGVIPANGIEPMGPSLATGMEKALGKRQSEQGINDFGAYLTARRMVAEYDRFLAGELERPPGPLSRADYQQAVASFEAQYPTFRAGAQDVYDFQVNFLKKMADKGMISRETYDKLAQQVDYVPMMRDMRDFADSDVNPGKTGTSGGLLLSPILRKFRGSDRMVINPLESIMKRVHDIEHAIKLNDAVASLAKLADEAGPGSGFIAEPLSNTKLRAQSVDVIEALRAAGRQAGVHKDDMSILIQQAQDQLGDSAWAQLFKQEKIDRSDSERIVFYWENGERRALKLADGRLGREMYHAMTALSDLEKNVFIQFLSVGQALLRSGVTRSFDFMAVNLVRDQITSMLTGGRKYVPFYSAAKGLIDALNKGEDSLRFAGGGGLSGGAIVEAIEASQFGRNIKGLGKQGFAKSMMKGFELSETGTRVGLYKSYFEQGKDLGMDDANANVWAIFKANDYIDFRRHGASMGVMRRIIPFLNATVQGTDKEFRAAFDIVPLWNKIRAGDTLSMAERDRLKDAYISLTRLALLGIVAGSGTALLNSENEKYKNGSKYNRDMNFLIPWGDKHVAVPKGFGIVQTVSNLFERGTEFAIRNDPVLAEQWLKAAGEAFAPPSNNPFVATFYDVTANWNRFQEREIVPFYLKGVDPAYQYGPYTSEFAKSLGKITGTSPLKIEYALNNTFGSLSRDFLFHWDNMMAKDRPAKQIYDYPVARRFIKNLDRGSQAQRAFFDLVGEQGGRLEQKENAYRHLVNTHQLDEAKDFLGTMKQDERVWTVMNTSGFRTDVKRFHPMFRAREYVRVSSGLIRQLATNAVLKEADIDRRNIVISRRDAEPIRLDAHERAQAMEALQSLSVAVARNAMVATNAKGTNGLGFMDTQKYVDQVKAISPELGKELDYRVGKKNLPSDESVKALWPEIQRRVMIDGEKAWFDDIVPKRRRSRSSRYAQ